MKHIYILIFIILICSCNEGAQLNSKLVGTNEWMPQPVTDNVTILGNWKMCAQYADGRTVKFSSCKTVVFNADGSGSAKSDSTKESFCWSLRNNLLIVYYVSTDKSRTFPDTHYLTVFKQNENSVEVEILHKRKDLLMLLEREQ